MKPIERQKICTHCEGRIAVEADTCPYCGIPLTAHEDPLSNNPSLQENITSLYTPPYSTRNAAFMKTEKEFVKAPLRKESHADKQLSGAVGTYGAPTSPTSESKREDAGSFMPLLFILVGANLFTLGLMQCFFSENGLLSLEWKSEYWFLYCLIAAPLIYFGLRKAKTLKESA